ncbi:ABC transporter substrate-binding protein [Donghicola sp.]|jgi:sn-glycerol 3-phosphate transport system substrate-binding protein|uniref:ABC transporter substrate-binding protein n=1 Tax=Donghicola sp. TaxID=1929294 RepID=UPI0025ED3B61|nr:ABC transporter substrate-binding protein [Donghicola sp.]MCT4577056.1 ABC transporter substrate-binding protein [Donghicola sp.]
MKLRNVFFASSAIAALASAASATDLEFYFPVAVGGAAADTIQALTEEYMANNADVNINAIYTGSYADTTTKAITAVRGGNAPQLIISLSTDMFTFIDEDMIVAWDDFVTEEEQNEWIGGFYPAFMANSQTEGKTWGIPFQRSTPVLYWNKEAFAAAGLNPEEGPSNWAEMVEMGKALTVKDDAGNVTQWGVHIPSSGFPSWLWTGIVAGNGGGTLADDTGTEVSFNSDAAVGALEALVNLSATDEVMAPGILDWGGTPKAFFDGQAAMIWTTTGNLTNVRTNAPFDFGVGFLPGLQQNGAPTGGGNFYLLKGSSDEELQAAADFVKWVTAPEQAAKWTIATGYVAPRPDVWDTDTMEAYTADFPQALVARDQLEYAVQELSTFEGPKVTQLLNSALESAITGQTEPQAALDGAQAAAEAILKPYY